jgi:hypothetical protein
MIGLTISFLSGAGRPGGSWETLGGSSEAEGAVVVQAGIPTSGNSISTLVGGTRTDPEEVAPAAANVTMLTWKDSRNADRTMVLNAYLYQYDFSFDDNRQVVMRSANDDANGHPGFGYVV